MHSRVLKVEFNELMRADLRAPCVVEWFLISVVVDMWSLVVVMLARIQFG